MSRSYTNKQGERITVSDEHLQTAVEIKLELQKASPSRRASMKQLVAMMEQEGYYDAESSEAYRCMLKSYQKDVGELPEAPKHADMVADNKLQSIKDLVGEVAYEKRENQHVLKQLNKVKREVIDFTLIAEQIGQAMRSHDWSKLKFDYKPLAEGGKKMIVCLSDLHIGALVDIDINTYNYEVAKNRMQQYLTKVVTEIKNNNISEVYLMNLGDVIEHPYMHNLSYTSEFVFADQVGNASDIIIKFMSKLSEYVKVTVAGIAGNHDRFNEDKHKNLDGDHAVKIINKAIQTFLENANNDRITYVQAKDYEHSIEINGIDVKFVHGDLDGINDQNLLAKHCSLDGRDYKLIVMGHYHHHWLREQGIDKSVVGFGSLKGADGHGAKTRRVSKPSQGFILVDEDGVYEIRQVKLK
jgi:predicted phosphodiesterase